MDVKLLQNHVAALENLAADSKAQQDLGRRLIQEVAQAVYEEKKGEEISNPDLQLVVKKGDVVPLQVRDQVPVNAEGVALQDALVQYLNLRIWLRIWVRFWFRIIIDTTFETLPINRFKDFADQLAFSDEEAALVGRLRKIAQ
jgi:hypothetical protein